jgi:DNA polymerase elongation subunit (family B)
LLVTKTIDKVMTGEIQIKDLMVSKMLGQDLTKYRSLFPHVSAALQLSETGKSLVRGDTFQYIFTDVAHKNPLRRVTPLDLISEEHDYDKENIVKCYWKRPNQYLDILVLIGQSTETGRKIGSGGMRLGKNVKKTYKLREIFRMDRLKTSTVSG